MSPRAERKFDAVLFDLLTALLNSWALWNLVAASPEDGRKWRAAYLRRTYETGAYRPYETLVAEAAAEVGLSPLLAAQLAARYGELKPWPEVREVLGALRREGMVLGVVTNCSEKLAATAVACTGIDFDVVVTAERAGFYNHGHIRWLCANWVQRPAGACSWLAPRTTCSARATSVCRPIGMTALAWRRLATHPNPSRTTARCTRSLN
jgi:hypothetical protein